MVPMISNDPLRSAGTIDFELLDGFYKRMMGLRVTHNSTYARVLGIFDREVLRQGVACDQCMETTKTLIASLDSLQLTTFQESSKQRNSRRSLSIPSRLHTLGCDQHCMYVPLRGLMSMVNQAADKSVDDACRQPCQSCWLAWGFPQQPLPPLHLSIRQQPIPPPHHLSQLQTS